MAPDPNPEFNSLLALVPAPARVRLFSRLELVDLELRTVVYEAHLPATQVYFPVDCILSTLRDLEDGETSEISVVGNEGVAGVSVLLGGGPTADRTIVISAGRAYRIPASIIRAEFDRHAELRELVLCYVQSLLMLTSQTALCNRYHSVEQQLCRWLLLSDDRMRGDVLRMTHQLIANMLGVRREGITLAARILQGLGLISYHRGELTIVNRAGLEQRCCECYKVVKEDNDRLFKRYGGARKFG